MYILRTAGRFFCIGRGFFDDKRGLRAIILIPLFHYRKEAAFGFLRQILPDGFLN